VGLIFTQVFSDLNGITKPMDAVMSRILAQGMADGEGPIKLARKIEAAINGTGLGDLGITDEFISETIISVRRRSEMIAHTEMMRAYHKSSMQEFKNWRELGIDVKAEWRTAGDNRVCDFCKALEGKIFTVEEIENMIPLHPECRCIALPYSEELLKYETKPKEEVDWLGQREGISTKNTHLSELYNYLTGTIMIRRLKTDVLLELPKIMFSFVPIELDNPVMYAPEELRFISFLKRESENDSNYNPEEIEDSYLERLIQSIGKAKLKQTIEWISNYLDVGNKLVLFSTNLFVLDTLANVFKGSSIRTDLTTSPSNQRVLLEEFGSDKKLRLLICNLETFDEESKIPNINYAFLEVPRSLPHMVKTNNILSMIEQGSKTNIYYLFGFRSIEDKIAKYLENDYQVNKSLWIDFQSILTRVKNEYCE
jgi:SPP1 gp7 family putative phage head morphogenesis protein